MQRAIAVRTWLRKVARRRPLVTAGAAVMAVLLVGAVATYLLVLGAPGRFSEDLALADPGQASGPSDRVTPRMPPVPEGRGESLGSHYGFGPGWPPENWQIATLPSSTRVYLVFSTGADGMSAEAAREYGITDLRSRGVDRRTDSIMLALVDRDTRRATLLSIPRDTWVYHRGSRINAVYVQHGLQAYVDEISLLTGLPIHHVARVSFQGFGELVDALGGIDVPVDRPLRDRNSRLYLPQAGCWTLDGRAALAYARSRYTETLSGGQWRPDGSASDFGRMRRQRQLMMLAWEQNRGPGLVRNLPQLFSAARGVTLDRGLGLSEMRDLVSAFQSVAAGGVEQYQLPTLRRRIGNADAQIVDADAAWPVVAHLRAWPTGVQAAPDADDPDAGTGDPTGEPPPPSRPPSQNRATLESSLCADGQPRLKPWPVADVVREWERSQPTSEEETSDDADDGVDDEGGDDEESVDDDGTGDDDGDGDETSGGPIDDLVGGSDD